jgi:DNA repair exonuclease SbcCD ATPase subunit
MNDICFYSSNLRLIPDACTDAENSVKESLYGLGEVTCKLEQELSSFSEYSRRAILNIRGDIAEVRALIREVDQKYSAAQSQKQRQLPLPSKPSIPSNATPEQRNAMESDYREQVSAAEEKNADIRERNQRIDEYCSRCNGAKQELEAMIADLHQLESGLRSETEAVVAEVDALFRKAQSTANQSGRINTAMSEFYSVFDQLLQVAQTLCTMQASDVQGYSYVDRLFAVKNTHDHHTTSALPDFSSAIARDAESDVVNQVEHSRPTAEAELLINTKDKAAFFEAAQGSNRIKMPSANLHKLGGKAFTAEMNALGFYTVSQEDGSLIDLNGMIHWEKQENGYSKD